MTDRRIAIVTDSSSQITADLVERFAVDVVPLTVTIDGTDHLEGVDLDADGFYAAFDNGPPPEIVTSQPAPGKFAAAYEAAQRRGCEEVVSIHIGEAMSGTVGSARIAADAAPLPVTVIDTGSASFGVSVCVWAAGVAIDRGANVGDIERRIAALAPRIATAFMIGVPLLTERGGRATGVELDNEGLQILAMAGGDVEVLDRVSTIDDTIDVMSTYVLRRGGGSTIAIGTADAPSRPLAERLERAVGGLDGIDQVVHYRVGPSIGAHTGPGTFGLFVFPTIK